VARVASSCNAFAIAMFSSDEMFYQMPPTVAVINPTLNHIFCTDEM